MDLNHDVVLTVCDYQTLLIWFITLDLNQVNVSKRGHLEKCALILLGFAEIPMVDIGKHPIIANQVIVS